MQFLYSRFENINSATNRYVANVLFTANMLCSFESFLSYMSLPISCFTHFCSIILYLLYVRTLGIVSPACCEIFDYCSSQFVAVYISFKSDLWHFNQ